jgi:hypothetical protein
MFTKPNVTVTLENVRLCAHNQTYVEALAAQLGTTLQPSVLFLTSEFDLDSDLLQLALNADGWASLRFNYETFPSHQLTHSYSHGEVVTTFRDSVGRSLQLSPKVVILRHFDHWALVQHESDDGLMFSAGQRRQMGKNLESAFPCAKWINSPSASRSCKDRLQQLRAAHTSNLSTPNTLVTNDRQEAEDFIRGYGSVIAKSIAHHGIRFGSLLKNFYGVQLTTADSLDFISQATPILIQEYFHKRSEIRVYVVENTIRAIKIEPKEKTEIPIDMHIRPLDSYQYSLCDVPQSIGSSCIQVARTLGLTYGAFDFVETEDGRLVFLEVNPAGDWAWVDSQAPSRLTDLLAKTVAGFLIGETNE